MGQIRDQKAEVSYLHEEKSAKSVSSVVKGFDGYAKRYGRDTRAIGQNFQSI
jgi:hypothetical protein